MKIENNSTGPYAIRLELLKLATEYHSNQFMWQKEYADREFDAATTAGKANVKGAVLQDALAKYPQPYTVESMMQTAEKMRSFIDSRHGACEYDPATGAISQKPQLLNE